MHMNLPKDTRVVSYGNSVSPTAELLNNLVSEGAVVASVNADSPAAEAGLEVDDIVTAVDGEPIASADGLIIAAREHQIGDTITLTVVRGDETLDIEVTLGSDAELQEENQDGTTGDSSGSLMDEDEFREYLENLMAQR